MVDASSRTDCCLVHPGSQKAIYQSLGQSLTAIEPPLWCRLICGYLLDRGFTAEIIDSEAESLHIDDVAKRVRTLQTKLVVIVATGHQPSASTQSMVSAGRIAKVIKNELPNQKIIMVGGHVSALPERTLREEATDYVCKGEGPVTVAGLLQALSNSAENADLSAIPGLVYRDGDAVRRNPSAPLIEDLDRDLHGNVWHKLPMDKYRAHNWQCFGAPKSRMPYASVYTTLGCPYKCSFCCINAPFESNRYRRRAPQSVVDEFVHLRDHYGVQTFKIIDEMFVLNTKHVDAICDLMIAAGGNFNIWAYARVDTVDASALEKMRRAGFQWLALGIESGSAHVRDGARKSLASDDIVSTVRSIQTAGINVIGNYIFGLPDDDHESMQATLDLAMQLNCEFANFYTAMAYPGSPLYEIAKQRGWNLPERWSGYSQHSYDTTPLATNSVGPTEVLKFRDDAFQAYFSAPDYRAMIRRKFGADQVQQIDAMQTVPLPRALLEGDLDVGRLDACRG